MNIGKTLIALIAGMAAGAIYGILYAPDKGSETRKKISDSSKQLADDGMDAVKELRQKITHHSHMGNGHGHSKSNEN
ncbi:MAG: YtxH domain-containing protein [Bacteroidota bacterium]|nr:YtxH domain-containing protein [Bacteroidota bacterium]